MGAAILSEADAELAAGTSSPPVQQPCSMPLMQPVNARTAVFGYAEVGAFPNDAVQMVPAFLLGSAETPTIGSIGHAVGDCKPCAFVFKPEGCGNGVECPFCHLCDPNEKKRRQKERRQFFHSFRTYAFGEQQHAEQTPGSSYGGDKIQGRHTIGRLGRRSGAFREAVSEGGLGGFFFRRG